MYAAYADVLPLLSGRLRAAPAGTAARFAESELRIAALHTPYIYI